MKILVKILIHLRDILCFLQMLKLFVVVIVIIVRHLWKMSYTEYKNKKKFKHFQFILWHVDSKI